MRKIFLLVATLAVFTLPLSSHAAIFRANDNLVISESEVIDENLYAAGSVLTIYSEVQGDVYAAGEVVSISGVVNGDVNVVGETVQLLNQITGDIRVAGATVTVGKEIFGEVMIAGVDVTILETSTITGKAYIAGSNVDVNGTINGDLEIYGEMVKINGEIFGNVKIGADKVILGSNAVIHGNLEYELVDQIISSTAPQVLGEVIKIDVKIDDKIPAIKNKKSGKGLSGFLALYSIFKLLVLVLTSLVTFFLFQKYSSTTSKEIVKNFGWNWLRGAVIGMIIPSAIFLLMITLLGYKLGLFLMALFILVCMLAKIFAVMAIGAFVHKLVQKALKKKEEKELSWQTVMIGVTVFWLLGLIPIFGWLVKFIFIVPAFGAVWYLVYLHVWLKREKKSK